MASTHLLLPLLPRNGLASPTRLADLQPLPKPRLANTLLEAYDPPPGVRVKNARGTADLRCGCGSWLNHRRRITGRLEPLCSVYGCANWASVGGHVLKAGDNALDGRLYVVPLCDGCNQRDEAFDLSADTELVSANVSLTCGR